MLDRLGRVLLVVSPIKTIGEPSSNSARWDGGLGYFRERRKFQRYVVAPFIRRWGIYSNLSRNWVADGGEPVEWQVYSVARAIGFKNNGGLTESQRLSLYRGYASSFTP